MKIKDFLDIQILIWDLDGTLYRSQKDLSWALHQGCIKILVQEKNLSFEKAEQLFSKTKEIHKGASKSLQALGCGNRLKIIEKLENIVDKASFLKPDRKLINLFSALCDFRHFLLSNTTRKTIIKELEALGLSHTLFELVIGVDDMKTTKPDLPFFKAALDYSDLSSNKHLVIGDRIEVDLAPAKQLGMKTCLVWSNNQQDSRVDITFPSVYNITELFF